MVLTHKLKNVDFYRKIPRDLTEASLAGAGLSLVAAFFMIFLFGMEFNNYLSVTTSTSIIVDRSADGEFLRIDFGISFPALSCEFASVDVSDVLGTNRLNITKTIRKFSINADMKPGIEYDSRPISRDIKHDDGDEEEYEEGSVPLSEHNFDKVAHMYQVLVVNFYAPWCPWCNRLKPSWEKAAKIIRERFDPEIDGRILLAKVDCTIETYLCRRHHIQAYPSIRIFRKGSDLRDNHGHHEHESYYGDRDTDSLVKTMEALAAPIALESEQLSVNGTDNTKRPAPRAGGCRIDGFVRVKRKISKATMSEIKRLEPFLGENHGRLNSREYIIKPGDSNANVTIEHYLQVVKSEVLTERLQKLVEEYEYTAHSSLIHSPDVPVAKFHFELSPMQVLIIEESKSFSHFITNVCAIIGGVFTVAGILDSILHNTMRFLKKVELGKNF